MSSNIKNMIFNEDINNSIRILGDVRERDPKYSKYVVNNDNWNDLESRQVIYSKKGSFIPDAERWQCAMCSYLKYKLFILIPFMNLPLCLKNLFSCFLA